MDEKVKAVLDAYHERIRAEQAGRTQRAPDFRQADDWHHDQLLAVGPDTGQLLNILARSLDAPHILELGTSHGYSTIWLADAARAAGGRVTTTELYDFKSARAREQAVAAGLADYVDFQVGNALDLIAALPDGIDFVLLDLWKDLYVDCLEAFYPKLNPGAIIVADNMIRPGGPNLQRYQDAVRAKPGITSVLLPVGTGIEVSSYEP